MRAAPPTALVHGAIESLQRLAELFLARREQLARGAGLTVAQWRVLEEIGDEQFMPSLFARRRASSAAAVSKVLRQLLDKGLIAVGIAPDDGRQRRYELTARGRRVMATLRRRRRAAIRAIWMDLDAGALEHFTRFSRELIARLEAHTEREE